MPVFNTLKANVLGSVETQKVVIVKRTRGRGLR